MIAKEKISDLGLKPFWVNFSGKLKGSVYPGE